MDSEVKMKMARKTLEYWQTGAIGWAPSNVSNKLVAARVDWLIDLTDCLAIWLERWCEKEFALSDGELILAYANLGALVEGWLKLFYCIYYYDYLTNSKINKRGIMVEPNNMKFEDLKIFSRGKLWQ